MSENCFGYCIKCNETHTLNGNSSREYCFDLMKSLRDQKRIDFDNKTPDSRYSIDYLYGSARGKMFGVLECESPTGETVILKAFSCQYNGVWLVDGWCPPLFDVAEYNKIVSAFDYKIKDLGKRMEVCNPKSNEYRELKFKRKSLSQNQMSLLHSLYKVNNFHGESNSLKDAFNQPKGIPTGTGDCCAPKLLNYAALNNLKPIGLFEFYWGIENRSGSREHGEFYSCCLNKCQPILGFMLCGIDK